ncbi:MAG: hypothetical protein SV377_06720 [Halobacteria archaeon]|nr:hypothetical protein [Halobacteria archaeon]
MRRIDQAFVVVVLLSAVLGGVTFFNFQDSLRTSDRIPDISQRVDIEVTHFRLGEESAQVKVRVSNPTRFNLTIQSAFFRMYAQNNAQLAYGSGIRKDNRSISLAPGESTLITYDIMLSPNQMDQLRSALNSGGFTLTGRQTLVYNEAQFTSRINEVRITETGEVS